MPTESTDPERQAADRDLFNQYRAALQQTPDDTNLLQSFCFALEHRFIDEIEEILVARLSAPQPSSLVRADELLMLAYIRERQGRRRLGLSCTNAAGIDDLVFRFVTQELADVRQAMIGPLHQKPDLYLAAAISDGSYAESRMLWAAKCPPESPDFSRVLQKRQKWSLAMGGPQ